MEEKDNIRDIMKSNIIICIIKCFLNIKELNDIFLSMNQINNLSSIAFQYYNLIKNKNSILNLESEIKNEINKKQIGQNICLKNNNPFENIIEIFISSINIDNLFHIEKQIIRNCQKCCYNTKKINYLYSSFDIYNRVYHEKIYLNKLLGPNDFYTKCFKCKKRDSLLILNKFIFVPQIFIIILKDNYNKYKIIYPKTDLNIECFINNNKDDKNKEILNISYKLKSLIIEKEKNIFESYTFSNDNDYSKCDDDDKFNYPIILLYQRPKNPLLDKIDKNNREDSFNGIDQTNKNENINKSETMNLLNKNFLININNNNQNNNNKNNNIIYQNNNKNNKISNNLNNNNNYSGNNNYINFNNGINNNFNNYNNNNYNNNVNNNFNNNYNNMNRNINNNNINININNINNNIGIIDDNKNSLNDKKVLSEYNIICLFFNFKGYNKFIHIFINEEESFSKVIEELKNKYLWFSYLSDLVYIYNGKNINENQKIKEIGLKDSSLIYIIF